MTGLSPNRLQVAQKFMTCLGRSDVDGVIKLLSSDATYHVIGDHLLSGTFSADEIMGHLTALITSTSGTLDATKFDDWLIGDQFVACVTQITFHGTGRRFSGHVVFLFRFDIVDLIDRVSVFYEDADAVSRFFGEKVPGD